MADLREAPSLLRRWGSGPRGGHTLGCPIGQPDHPLQTVRFRAHSAQRCCAIALRRNRFRQTDSVPTGGGRELFAMRSFFLLLLVGRSRLAEKLNPVPAYPSINWRLLKC